MGIKLYTKEHNHIKEMAKYMFFKGTWDLFFTKYILFSGKICVTLNVVNISLCMKKSLQVATY
jgi:hypothetical protein